MLPHGKLHPDSMSFVCLVIPSSRPVGFGAIVVVHCLPIANPGAGRSDTIAFPIDDDNSRHFRSRT
jgi:hypothetical protein